MLLSLLLLTSAHLAPVPVADGLLGAVPADAYALVHCRDAAALQRRAESNDWYRLLGSPEGEPLLGELARELGRGTHSDPDRLLELAAALEGEVVFFDTGTVAGLVTAPPASRAELAGRMRDWLPRGGSAPARALELGGAAVELVAWPDELDGWSGRAGHFAAFVDHPRALALYSGDDSAAVVSAVTQGLAGLEGDQRAALVSSYLGAGGGQGGGVELYVDFTPLVEEAEAALREAVEDVLPDPTRLLGLEAGTWLHAGADLFAGTRVDCRARLHLPPDTLAARLADTFQPLPRTLPADLPAGVWGLWALNWDLKLFYERARAAFEEAGGAEGLGTVDAGIEASKGLAGIDPIVDVLNQLAGDFVFYLVEPASAEGRRDQGLHSLGFHFGLVDGDAFLATFEQLIEVGRLEETLDLVQIAGVDAYVMDEADEGLDGGMAFLPRAFAAAPTRGVLERSLRALTRAEGASLPYGSRMQAAIDEQAGACFLWCVELTPLRAFLPDELRDGLHLPPLEEGRPVRDPFDAQLISTVRRTPEGFEFRVETR